MPRHREVEVVQMSSHNHFTVAAATSMIVPAKKGFVYSLLKPLSKMKFKRFKLTGTHHAPPELLLHSNLPPTDSERAAVSNVVAAVEEEIAQLQQEPKSSQRRRRRLTQCTELLRVHNAVLSPIRCLPTEVLEEIFRQCASPLILNQDSHWKELSWALSQVCRTWREITLNLPCLWNRIPIHLGDNTLANLAAQATFLTGLLARSRNAPLYLHVQAPFKEYDWHPLISALIPHSERIEELTINSSTVTMNAFRKCKGHLPLLRKLALSKTSQRNHPSALIIDLFEDAPLLREVTLFALYTHELILPWPQIISFNGSRINRTGLSQLVANSLDLEHLEIAGYSYGAGPRTATLRSLTTLKVKLENPSITSNFFFGSLHLPNVQEIKVEEYQGDLLPHLVTMLSRSSPTTPSMVRKLTLRNIVQESPGDLALLLRLTPQLVELDLDLPPIYDLSGLVVGPEIHHPLVPMLKTQPPLVPLLETLIIHVVKAEDTIWKKENPATAIARSRCEIENERRRKLKTFRITFSNNNNNLNTRHIAQTELNGWLVDDSSSSKPSSSSSSHHFKSWRQTLHEELPELDHKPPPLMKKFDLKKSHRLDQLLGAIEEYQFQLVDESDMKLLYASGLHSSLRRLSHMRPNTIPGENIYHFRSRSQEILNNWAPFLRKNLGIVQWVMEGTDSLIYIPLNDALRESTEALDMVYGLHENG